MFCSAELWWTNYDWRHKGGSVRASVRRADCGCDIPAHCWWVEFVCLSVFLFLSSVPLNPLPDPTDPLPFLVLGTCCRPVPLSMKCPPQCRECALIPPPAPTPPPPPPMSFSLPPPHPQLLPPTSSGPVCPCPATCAPLPPTFRIFGRAAGNIWKDRITP